MSSQSVVLNMLFFADFRHTNESFAFTKNENDVDKQTTQGTKRINDEKKYMLVYVVTGFAVITFFVFIFYMYLRICQRQPHTRMINLAVI